MMKFFSTWVKTLGLSVVIVSILEMLLPNNKTKKYIRMVMGIYILFTIISPFISNKDKFDINNIDFENYISEQTTSMAVNQTTMDKRIEELYIEQLEKDITKKLEQEGYEVKNCKVDAKISDNEKDTKIEKIKLKLDKVETKEESIENKIVAQIQKVKPIDTSIKNDEKENETKKLNKSDIQNVKKFLIEEYGVSEKCLEIN